MRDFTIRYIDGAIRNLYADRCEDNGSELVFYVPKKYVSWRERGRDEVPPLQSAAE